MAWGRSKKRSKQRIGSDFGKKKQRGIGGKSEAGINCAKRLIKRDEALTEL